MIKVLTFFNNKGGVGKTSLVYHLAWMFASLDKRVLVVDLDPQANLTSAFLDEDTIDELWNAQKAGSTIHQCVKPLTDVGDIVAPVVKVIEPKLGLIPGDVALSQFEENLSAEWPNSVGAKVPRPMRILSSFWQVMQLGANQFQADIIFVDIGPNLGAINRSVLISTDFVVIPLAADLFSLQGLKNLGPTLTEWKREWQIRLANWRSHKEFPNLSMPEGKMLPLGYLCQQHGVRLSRPVKAFDKWVNRIPTIYRRSVLGEEAPTEILQADDPFCLASIKHYHSLIPMAQEHRKPIFLLTNADGAIGTHAGAVAGAKRDFEELANKIAQKIGIFAPP